MGAFSPFVLFFWAVSLLATGTDRGDILCMLQYCVMPDAAINHSGSCLLHFVRLPTIDYLPSVLC